jgi:hypothetical protein
MAEIAAGLATRLDTQHNIALLARALLRQMNNTVQAEIQATRLQIIELKGLLTASGSHLPLNCALWMTYWLSRGYYVCFSEHFGDKQHFDCGLQPKGNWSCRFVLNLPGVADIPEVRAMVEARAVLTMAVLDSVTCGLQENDPLLKLVVVATMYNNFCGRVLPLLTPPRKGSCQRFELLPGAAVSAYDHEPFRHPESIEQLGLKILHFSYICAQALRPQLLSMLQQLNAKLHADAAKLNADATTLNAEAITLELLPPSEDDMDKIDAAFCFATDFTADISYIITGMSEEYHNAKKDTVDRFLADSTFWPNYIEHGHDVLDLKRQIYAVLKALGKITIDEPVDAPEEQPDV